MAVAVAVSGGVDSLAALLLVREQSPRVIAVHGLFHGCGHSPSLDTLRAVCRSLSVPFHVLDLRDVFRERVVDYFRKSYGEGLTPNPCVICNRDIKFGVLREACANLGADQLATGHYARLCAGSGLWRGADRGKDQSYFLSLVPGEALGRAIFPLGDYTKGEVRRLVAGMGLTPPTQGESQDICFPGERGSLPSGRRGPVRLIGTGQKLGEHGGLEGYTVGQRRGLGVPWQKPLYVRKLDVAANTLWVAPRDEVLMCACRMRMAQSHVPDWQDCPGLQAQLRYNQKPVSAQVSEGGTLLTLESPILATAPGQVAAIYTSEGQLLAAGIVEEVIFESEK